MKHIIYADAQKLNSFYAQAFDGLENSRTKGEKYTQKDSERHEPTIKKLFRRFGVGLGAYVHGEESKETTSARKIREFCDSEEANQSVTTLLHDNSLTHIMEFACEQDLVCDPNNPCAGYYSLIKGEYDIVHIGNLTDRILSDEMIDSIASVFEKTTIEALQKKKIPQNLINQNAKQARERMMAQYKGKRSALATVSKILPFDLFTIIGNYVIPMKAKCFQEDLEAIPYIYEEKMAIFGRVTRVCSHIGDSSRPNDQMVKSINAILVSVFNNIGVPPEEMVYLYPIAAFFE